MFLTNLLARLGRRETVLSKRARYGEIAVAGETLTSRKWSTGPAVSVRAQDMLEVWYDYNPYGWMHANSWRLVYCVGTERKQFDIYEYKHLQEPLLIWFTSNLPQFDAPTYNRLFGSPGGDEPSILVWARGGGA